MKDLVMLRNFLLHTVTDMHGINSKWIKFLVLLTLMIEWPIPSKMGKEKDWSKCYSLLGLETNLLKTDRIEFLFLSRVTSNWSSLCYLFLFSSCYYLSSDLVYKILIMRCLEFVVIVFIHFQPRLSNLSSASSEDLVAATISNVMISQYPQNKLIFVIYKNVSSEVAFPRKGIGYHMWDNLFDKIVTRNGFIDNSGGMTKLHASHNQNSTTFRLKQERTMGKVEQVIILISPKGPPNQISIDKLIFPVSIPPTSRNFDKYIFVTAELKINTISSTGLWSTPIKYMLLITTSSSQDLPKCCYVCPHCPEKCKLFSCSSSDLLDVRETNLFIDFQENYFGHVITASVTDKMPGFLEFKDGLPRRGMFLTAFDHLAEGLNFTRNIMISSGGGSSGTRFPNGTWVGSVGDVLKGDASLCLMCSVSESRHTVMDMCAPIVYEYVRFAIGPPDKVYTWVAIFWPFTGYLWIAFLMATGLTTWSAFFILRWSEFDKSISRKDKKWTLISFMQYFSRIFLEQSDDIPDNFPQGIRVLLGFWLFFAAVGTTAYRAKMVTLLTFPVFVDLPDTYDELVGSDYHVQFHYFPNVAYNSFKASTNPILKKTFDKFIKVTDPLKCLQNTLTDKAVCVMFTASYTDVVNRNLSDKFGHSPIRASFGYAFMFTPGVLVQKHAVFFQNFRKILGTSMQMGLNDQWLRSESAKVVRERNSWIRGLPRDEKDKMEFKWSSDSEDNIMLHLRHLSGAFTIFFGGLGVASVLFLGEHLQQYYANLIT